MKYKSLIAFLLGCILFTAFLIALAFVETIISQLAPSYPRGVVFSVGLVSLGISRCTTFAYPLVEAWGKKRVADETA